VLPSRVRACDFCDSSFSADLSSPEDFSVSGSAQNSVSNSLGEPPGHRALAPEVSLDAWRGELASRVQAYRRRRGSAPRAGQSQFVFEESSAESRAPQRIAVADPTPAAAYNFSFTIAI
jgi:hypothetical protein